MLEDSGDEGFLVADIAILPPLSTGNETYADSGDEFVASGDSNNLNRNQLLTVRSMCPSSKTRWLH